VGERETEQARWVAEMRDTVDDLLRRSRSGVELSEKARDEAEYARLAGKGAAYDHAAEMLEAAIKRMERS
jgi:hypothetical protein